MNPKPTIYIGIDPGTHTGIAIWDCKSSTLTEISTMKAHAAMDAVLLIFWEKPSICVLFEDARLRTWFGNTGKERLMGAGSIRRDCTIWEEFLTDYGIPFETVPPKNVRTKLSAEQFERYTGWTQKTSEHGRDAAMLIFGK